MYSQSLVKKKTKKKPPSDLKRTYGRLQVINQSKAFAQRTSNKWEASLLVHRPIANREQTLKQAVALADIQNIERDQLVHQVFFLVQFLTTMQVRTVLCSLFKPNCIAKGVTTHSGTDLVVTGLGRTHHF